MTPDGPHLAHRTVSGAIIAYGLLCLASLGMVYAADKGLFGIEGSPAGLLAIGCALPWSLAMPMLMGGDVMLSASLLTVGMGMNISLLMLLRSWLRT